MPKTWVTINKFDKDWDIELNSLLDQCDFTEFMHVDSYAKLGDVLIWVANHPNASFTKEDPFEFNSLSGRPSRLTVERAMKKLKQDKNKITWSNNDKSK